SKTGPGAWQVVSGSAGGGAPFGVWFSKSVFKQRVLTSRWFSDLRRTVRSRNETHSVLAEKKACSCDSKTNRAHEDAAEPEDFAFRQQRKRTDDQSDFQQHFSEIEAVRAMHGAIALGFKLFRDLAHVLLVGGIVLHFFLVFLAQLLAFFLVEGRNHADEV